MSSLNPPVAWLSCQPRPPPTVRANTPEIAMNKRFLMKAVLGLSLALSLPAVSAQAEDALARVKAAGVLKVGTE